MMKMERKMEMGPITVMEVVMAMVAPAILLAMVMVAETVAALLVVEENDD